MAMIEVEVSFMVNNGGVTKTEYIKTQVDDKTYSAATSSSSRPKLDAWAKQFFPTAKQARVVSIKRL
ncbi:MAG: hypothetical protein ACXWCZ_12345 [Flavisolibacter sp.]